jgi:CRP/FNR family transcriptional regulator, cyclic AMP receptor protein
MSTEDKNLEARIGAHPFLSGMKPDHIKILAECALPTQFEADQLIFRAGETANRFYLIGSGQVVLEGAAVAEGRVIIDVVSAGDLLGWSWLFPPYIWQFDARASKPTTAIFFYGTILREYCEKDPALGYELFKRMSEVITRRLQSARGKLIEEIQKTRDHG